MSFLRKIHKKSKYKLFHIPLDLSVLSILGNKQPFVRKQVGHLHYFTKDTALLTLLDTGYEVIDFFYTPSSIDRGKSIGSKLLKFPRKLFTLGSVEMTARILGGYSLLVLTK